jgi:hypothetical protein
MRINSLPEWSICSKAALAPLARKPCRLYRLYRIVQAVSMLVA